MEELIRVFMNGISGEVADTIAALPAVERVEDANEADVWLVNDAHGLALAASKGVDQVMLIVNQTEHLVGAFWNAPVVVTSSDSAGVVIGALEAAAHGDCYISPSAATIMRQIPTPEEHAILHMIFECPNATLQKIAGYLYISRGGARSRLHRLYTLACVRSRAGLIVEALRRGWIDPREYGLVDVQINERLPDYERELLHALFHWPNSSIEDLCHVLGAPEGTVRTRMRALFSRAGVHRREALLIEALRQGWATLDELENRP